MEFNWTEITLAIIAIVASVVTHKLDKKKHRVEIAKLTAETTSDNIDNMGKSLDFYDRLAENTNKRLDQVLEKQEEIIKENETLRNQVSEVSSKMAKLTTIICTKLTCVHREVDEAVIECIYPTKSVKGKNRLKTSKVKEDKN